MVVAVIGIANFILNCCRVYRWLLPTYVYFSGVAELCKRGVCVVKGFALGESLPEIPRPFIEYAPCTTGSYAEISRGIQLWHRHSNFEPHLGAARGLPLSINQP